jgi:hypothetical protein
MTWVTLDDSKYRHAIKEIPRQRDRGAGLIATSILEDHLVAAIKTRLDKNEDIQNKMFKGYGPLASLHAKIDLGHLLGLYPINVHRMLHEIRELRNDFAHNPLPVSFRSQRARCERLAFPVGARRKWNRTLQGILKDKVVRTALFQRSKNPRTQFIRAIQAVTAILAFETVLADISEYWEKTRDRAPQPRPPSPDKSESPLPARFQT